MTSRLFVLAGEASGDVLAAQLMHAVGKAKGPVDWTGMGGPHMKEAGLTSSEDMSQLSVIGIADALAALPRLYRLADRLIEQVLDTRPDIVFTVDSKAFSVRFAKRLRKRLAVKSGNPSLSIWWLQPSGPGVNGAKQHLSRHLMVCYACFRLSQNYLIKHN